MPPPPALAATLKTHGQDHVLAGWDNLTAEQQRLFADQLGRIDFDELKALYAGRDGGTAALPARDRIAPIPVEPHDSLSAASRAAGEGALRRGEVAALIVAGGQGSRLGFDKPKGMYPVGPVSRASLFQVHAEKVLALGRRYGKTPPFLVMTSPATDAETKAFFEANRFFGLNRDDVTFFQQGTMPAVDIATGKLLLAEPGSLALSPNGHGGTLTALREHGLLDALRTRGVKHVFYFQVDNPLVDVCDPSFVGRHVEVGSEASSKVVFKEQPGEKVGVFALVDGRCAMVEYSDMPAAMASERDAAGDLAFRAGNPAIHLFGLDFLARITAKGGGLDYHVARKKVPHIDPATGTTVTPAGENGLKFEMFVFDALPLADRFLVVQTRRESEFAPLKNASGGDSPATVHDLMVGRHAGWVERAGGVVPRGADGKPTHAVEVSPLFALDADELTAKLPAGFTVTGPTLLK